MITHQSGANNACYCNLGFHYERVKFLFI